MSDNTKHQLSTGHQREEVDPHLAQPLEAAARRSDAAAVEHGMSRGDELLSIYRLEPIAAPDDPRWDNAPGHGVVTVAARSTGDARLVAASQELDYMEIDAKPAEDVTTGMASAFRSEKLYTVIEIARDRQGLTRGLIEGEIGIDTIRPVQI
ncbi:MAG: hypothetical protein KJ981_11315 [Alphaproteobacteria bacterium]|nr:hypothetical protein [Alphaproteobacteria bacterium]MBU0833051.1 hypothetical protein [Alphaproteobacteria bacterium]MBU1764479.1 hypothetical protein [Alphaproteobacteria bacterium]